MMDQTVERLQGALSAEREVGRINDLHTLQASKIRRQAIKDSWDSIQAQVQSLKAAMDALPELPIESEIQWTQAVKVMRNLVFLEVDTTGLDANQDEITRVVVLDWANTLVLNTLICPGRPISKEASHASGLYDRDVEHAPSLPEAWERIQKALHGRYVVSFSWKFDTEHLNASALRHQLPPLFLIGDDLQRHCTCYYHREYYLTLEAICERVGHPLPVKPEQTALDRAHGQYRVLHALAHAVYDVRPAHAGATAVNTVDEDALGDLDDHPF